MIKWYGWRRVAEMGEVYYMMEKCHILLVFFLEYFSNAFGNKI